MAIFKFNFGDLDYHFNKHVKGKDEGDTRSKKFIKREKEQWEYKKVYDANIYRLRAEENIDYSKTNMNNGSRIYEYEDKGNVYINYQKGDITYSDKIYDDYLEFDKLLTTGLDVKNNTIKTCFYKTKRYSNIELLTMVNTIYSRCSFGYDIEDTTCNIHIAGFNLNTFTKELRVIFWDLIKEYYVIPKYNKKSAIKMVLVSLLKEKLKCDNSIAYDLLMDNIKSFISSYKNRENHSAKDLCPNTIENNEKILKKCARLEKKNKLTDDSEKNIKIALDNYYRPISKTLEIFELNEYDFEKMITIE